MSSAPNIRVDLEGSCARVTIDRADRRNAMTLAMWQGMADVFGQLGADRSVRAIVLTGAGADFSTGADIGEFDEIRHDAAASAAYEVAVDACSSAIESVPQPTVAALHGYCLGGGCHLSLACDFRVADATARIGIPAARLSIVYGLRSTQRLLALVGLSNAKRILFSAMRLEPEEARRVGLVDEIATDSVQGAVELVRPMIGNAPLSIAGAKRLLNDAAMRAGALSPSEVQGIIDHASNSHDYREGRAAFREKRAPRFRGD